MRSKAEIERQLIHFDLNCQTDPAVKAVWIEALNWVLGDAEHRLVYAQWIATFSRILDAKPENFREIAIRDALNMALDRLR